MRITRIGRAATEFLIISSLALIFALCSYPSGIAAQSAAADQAAKTVSIIMTQATTDTGIMVAQDQPITVAASGILNFRTNLACAGHLCLTNPSGETCSYTGFYAQGLPCYSLIGQIGDGPPFVVGSSLENFPAPSSGELYLGVNDNYYPDNTGNWTAVVCTTTQDGTGPCRTPRPHIIFNGVDVTDDPSQAVAVIGQQIYLVATAGSDNQLWNIDPKATDSVIGGYTPTDSYYNTAAVLPVTTFTDTSITYYWVTPGTFRAQYDYTAPDGTNKHAETAFTVSAPTQVNISNISRDAFAETTLLDGSISCGGEVPDTGCVEFAPTLAQPSGEAQATIEFVQLLVYDEDDLTVSGGQKYECSYGGGYDLDNTYPYIAIVTNNGVLQYSYDSPAIPLESSSGNPLPANIVYHHTTFRAKMFLLWKSQTANAIWVPVGNIDWSWEARARLKEDNTWKLEGSLFTVDTAFQTSSRYPVWSGVSLNTDLPQCVAEN